MNFLNRTKQYPKGFVSIITLVITTILAFLVITIFLGNNQALFQKKMQPITSWETYEGKSDNGKVIYRVQYPSDWTTDDDPSDSTYQYPRSIFDSEGAENRFAPVGRPQNDPVVRIIWYTFSKLEKDVSWSESRLDEFWNRLFSGDSILEKTSTAIDGVPGFYERVKTPAYWSDESWNRRLSSDRSVRIDIYDRAVLYTTAAKNDRIVLIELISKANKTLTAFELDILKTMATSIQILE